MVFYGTNASRLKDIRLNNVTCPNCNEQTSMTYSFFFKIRLPILDTCFSYG